MVLKLGIKLHIQPKYSISFICFECLSRIYNWMVKDISTVSRFTILFVYQSHYKVKEIENDKFVKLDAFNQH